MTMKDGNIYFWRWKDEVDAGDYAYHCRSMIAISDGGRLVDTYWSSRSSEYQLDLDKVDAVYQGNIEEMTVIQTYQSQYYKTEDVVDTRHANNSTGPVYLKDEAHKDPKVMRAVLDEKRAKAKREIDFGINTLEEIQRKIVLLDQGDIEDVYL